MIGRKPLTGLWSKLSGNKEKPCLEIKKQPKTYAISLPFLGAEALE